MHDYSLLYVHVFKNSTFDKNMRLKITHLLYTRLLNSLNFIDLPVFKKVKGHTSRSIYYIQIVQNEYEEIQIGHAQKID